MSRCRLGISGTPLSVRVKANTHNERYLAKKSLIDEATRHRLHEENGDHRLRVLTDVPQPETLYSTAYGAERCTDDFKEALAVGSDLP